MDRKLYILAGIIALVVIISSILIFKPAPEERVEKPKISACGNGECETGENCYDCPVDCKCGEGEYCSHEAKKCILPVCGNNDCEPFEPEICCDDCGCLFGQVCNKETHRCEPPKVNISDERVKELITDYFKDQNKTVVSIEITGSTAYRGKGIKQAMVTIKEQGWLSVVSVTEDGEVRELPTL